MSDLDYFNKVSSAQRVGLSLFGKIIKQEEERQLKMNSMPPSQEVLDKAYKPTRTENEAHLESIFGDSEDVLI